MNIKISICTYSDGAFEVMLRGGNGEEITFSGEQDICEENFEFINEIAPACVWTEYKRVTPSDEGEIS